MNEEDKDAAVPPLVRGNVEPTKTSATVAPSSATSVVAPKQAAKAPLAIAERIKAWGDAATALLKAVLLTLTIVASGIVVGSAIWRDDPSRHIAIQVDADAEKALRMLGSDLDLRQTLIDSLNDGLHGVAQIVEFQGLRDIVPQEQGDEFSFKPFGLEFTTTDITRMIREVRGTPPSRAARIDLVCTPRPCNEAGATDGSLLVTISDSEGSHRVSYPVPLVNPGLRRALHQAMQRSADVVLERTQPLIASVLYLNRQPLFEDQRRDSLERAAGAALRARGASDEASCVADLVIGGSLTDRERWSDGIAIEKRAGESSNPTCKIHAATNVVFMLFWGAVCASSSSGRDFARDESRQALARLPKADRAKVGNLVFNRIPTSRLNLEIEDVLGEAANDPAREALCRQATVAPPNVQASLVDGIRRILKHTQELLPPSNELRNEEHWFLDTLRALLNVGTPRADLAGRWVTGRELNQAIDAYLVVDRHPRRLFLVQGKLAMDMAWAARDALALESAQRQAAVEAGLRGLQGPTASMANVDPSAMLTTEIDAELSAARVAFENAAGTESAGPLVEPAPNIEALTLLGDELVAAGDILGARDVYARAVDAFIQDGVPVDQIIRFADAVSRWAVLRMAGGACQKDAPADRSWEQRWARLGGGGHDVCSLGQPDKAPAQPSLFAIIRPLVVAAATNCVPKPGQGPDWQADRDRRFALVDCLRARGHAEQEVVADFFKHQSGAMVSAEIDSALGRRQ